MRSRLWLVLALILVLLVPCSAYADESVDISRDGGEQTVLMLAAPPATPLTLIQSFFANARFSFFGSSKNFTNLHTLLSSFLGAASMNRLFMALAVALVLMWWGARKVIRMLFRSLRKGKINA